MAVNKTSGEETQPAVTFALLRRAEWAAGATSISHLAPEWPS